MQIGETVKARTNAEFLNELLNKNYKQWYKGRYLFSDNSVIWMIRIDDCERNGWKNTFLNENTILEKYNSNSNSITHKTDYLNRIVFDIQDSLQGRIYIFRGIYKYCEKESSLGKNVLAKISDVFLEKI